jgi:hypothetical protein
MVTLLVRLFVEVPVEQAAEVAEQLRQRLETVVARARISVVRQYWKIPEYQELQLEVEGFGDPSQVVSSVIARLGTGWTQQSGTEAIWNPMHGAEFAEPSARWAHVEVLE